jgi:hypothetical protein
MKFGEQATFQCPYCGGSAGVAKVESVDADDTAPASLVGSIVAVHYEPRCQPFETMEANDFMDAAIARRDAQARGARGVA